MSRALKILKDLGWQGVGKAGVSTVFLSIIVYGVGLLQAIINLPTTVLQNLAGLINMANNATIGGILGYLSAALSAGGNAFGSGWTALLGPLQGPFGLALTLFMFWEVAYYMDFVNTDVIGFVVDLWPLSGDESAAAGDEGE